MMNVRIKKLDENAIIPKYAKIGDAGVDLYTLEDTIIKANETKIVKTGIAIELENGTEAQVRPRSGISLNGCKGCFKLEPEKAIGSNERKKYESSPYLRVQLGTVDSNYRGDIGIITYNQEAYDVLIPKGTRLAQLVIAPVLSCNFIESDELKDTDRGEDGFGSTGTF